MHIDHYMKRDKQKRRSEEEEEERKMEVVVDLVVVVEEEEDALAGAAMVAAAAAVEEEEELWRMKLQDVVVDELMTWDTAWLPSCWDVEFVEKNYEALFNDVVWEDDLWNLNTST